MKERKGVILAGGRGTRLLPATRIVNKHLIPILEKPMILYPLMTLTSVFGVKDVLIISGGEHLGGFAEFLGDGAEFGVSLTYRVQAEAGGIAQALGLAAGFAGSDELAVILGDNVFDAGSLRTEVGKMPASGGAHLFVKEVPDARRFGVATLAGDTITRIVEKPAEPESAHAVTGLYLYPPDVFEKIARLTPSPRGELEITDVNNAYVAEGRCVAHVVSGFWSDAGTPESLARTVAWASERAMKGS